MFRKIKYTSSLVLLLPAIFFINAAIAQSTFTSEDDLKKEAKKLFDNEQYTEAYPLYSQLLSVYPKDPNYNYRFGICMLYTSENKEKPVSYLEYAAKQPDVEKDVFFFLGKAYHLNYRFDDAIVAYNRFKTVASAYQLKKLQVDKQIDMCRNGKTLLKNITDLQVLEKKQLSDKEFFRSYDLNSIGGKLLVKPEDFQSSLDKKAKEQTIIYLAKNNNQIYYSSYGTDGKNGKDIYVVKKLPNGEWSLPTSLGSTINTELDEDYPFLHPNGKVLYFCSKGHNSMGGYDIFKSTLTAGGTWTTPVNMDFSINTPDDDIMFVTDSLEKTAYFSSKRTSPSGMIDVYKINTDRKPVDVAVINGMMAKNSEGGFVKSRITIKNASNGELVGIFNSDPQTGQYSMNVPGGSKLLFTVEGDGYSTQSEVVVLPTQQVFKPFRQEIKYEDKTDKLIIKNFFDEAIDDNNYLLALNFIKEKAKMDVNANEAMFRDTPVAVEITPANQDSSHKINPATDETKTPGTITNGELVKIAYDDAEDAQKDARELKNQADLALAYANEKNKSAQAKYSEAGFSGSPEVRKEAEKISRETVAAFNLAKKLEADASAKQDEADLSLNYAKELDAAAHAKNSTTALAQLEEQKKRLESMSHAPKGVDNAYNSIKVESDNKHKEAERSRERSKSLAKDIVNIDTEIKNLEQTASASKNEQLKEGLLGQIKDLQDEKNKKQAEIVASDADAVAFDKESDNLRNEADIVSGMMGQIKSGGEAPASVASIDKQKLQEQVNGYEMKDAAVGSGKATIAPTIEEAKAPETNAPATKTAEPGKETPAVEIKPAENKQVKETDTTSQPPNVEKNTAPVPSEEAKKPVEQTPPIPVPHSVSSYDKKYIAKLDEANQINDDYTRETTKSTYYKSWADSISRDVASKKEELLALKDETEKKQLEQTISGLEAEAVEKQALSEKSKEKAKVSISGSIVTTANSDSAKKVADQSVKGPQIVSSADTIKKNEPSSVTPSAGKEEVKVPASTETAANKTVESNTNTEAVKTAEIPASSDLPGNPTTADKETITATPPGTKAVSVEPVNNETANTPPLVTAPANNATPVKNISEQTKNNVPVQSDNAVSTPSGTLPPMSAANTEIISGAATKTKEAQELDGQAMALRSEAYSKSDPAERDAALQRAGEIEAQAVQKQVEAADVTAKVNAEEYNKRNEKLENYSKLFANNQTDDVMMADMVKDEAKYYFEEAKKSREKAALSSSFSQRQDNLAKAEQNERIAFEKQDKANELYAKTKPIVAAPVTALSVTPDAEKPVKTTKQVPPTVTAEPPVPANGIKQPESPTQSEKANKEVSVTNETALNTAKTPAPETQEKQPVTEQEQQQQQQPANQNKTTEQVAPAGSLNQQQIRQVQDTKEYGHYVDLKTEADSTLQVAKLYYATADDFQKQADAKNKEADPILKKIEEVPEGSSVPDSLSQQLSAIKSIAFVFQQKADSARKYAKNAEYIAANKQTESESFLETLDPNTSKLIVQAYNGKTGAPVTASATVNETTAKNSTQTKPVAEKKVNAAAPKNTVKQAAAPATALTEGFEVSRAPVYSSNNPIPVDPKLPEGLVFKVQIGAFKNQIPQDAFRGLNPLTAETTQKGWIRYTAGLFRDLSPANAAKSKIQGLGYRDAFVVAFYNGKRISYGEATAMLNGGKVPAGETNQVPVQANATEAPAPQNNNTVQQNVGNNAQSQNNVVTTPAKTTDIATVSGVVYTVQVGVYSKPVTAAQLFNIGSLYTETMNNGLKRYTSGAYTDIAEAMKAKDAIVARGIRDAFIIVYKDGKRVTGGALGANSTRAKTNTEPAKSATPVSAADIVFKVQIGAYKSEVPIDVANKILSVAAKGVNVNKDETGMTIYTVGSFKTYEEAVKTKDELVGSGIADAFVVAYNKAKRMNLDEAKNLIK